MNAEWRLSCGECGRRQVQSSRPKIGVFHWGGPYNGYRKCAGAFRVERRDVGRWKNVTEQFPLTAPRVVSGTQRTGEK